MDLCDLIDHLRAYFFAKDRDVYVQTGRVIQGWVPIGGIIAWSGAIGSIPSGWQICDGTNGTPDLRDRFIMGAGSSYAVDATGGATTIDIRHDHGGNTGAGTAHDHGAGSLNADSPASSCFNNGPVGTEESVARCAHSHDVSGSTANESAHTHSISNDLSANQSILNPYYALAWIQRMT